MSAQGGGSFLDILLSGLKRVMKNGAFLPFRPNVNFVNAVDVLDNPTLNSTDVFLVSTGGTTGGSLLIIENNGTPLPLEPVLNFIGFTLADNPGIATNVSASTGPTRLSAAATLTNTQLNVYANTSGGGFALTFPPSPTDGQKHKFYDDHGTWGSGKFLTLTGNTGQLVWDDSIGSFTAAAGSVILTGTSSSVTYEYDLTRTRWHF